MSTLSALLNTPRPTEEQALGLPEGDGGTRLYRGRSIDELIPKIEAELGLDAIVVRRKRGLEGGIGGFFQRPYVEIEAKPGGPGIDVYDEDSGAPALPPALQSAPTPAVRRPAGAYVTDTLASIAAAGSPEPTVEDPPRPAAPAPVEEFRELTPDTFGAALAAAEMAHPLPVAPQATPVAPQATPASPEATPVAPQATPASPQTTPASLPSVQSVALESELERIEDDMSQDVPRLSVMRPRVQAPTPRSTTPRWERLRANIQRSMTGLGVSEELAEELIDSAIAHAVPFAPRIGLARAVHGALVARMPVNPLLPAQGATVAVVGPGGSGKTSCCAAVLGAYRRAGTLPASCASIMLDSEHKQPTMLLSPYIMEPASLGSARAREVLAEARSEGLLLLDLPALSPAERPTIRMIAGLLDELKPDRVVVALPATLGARAAAQLLEALRPLGTGGLAITHADETDQIGVAVEAACTFGLAPEYLLDRGRVRGGLTRIDPTHLADRLLP